MIGYWDLPVEVRRIVDEAAENVRTAKGHIQDRNYGIADEWLNTALEKLPINTGEETLWPELERRTT